MIISSPVYQTKYQNDQSMISKRSRLCHHIITRESQVLGQKSCGLTIKQISPNLLESNRTIISHRQNLIEKLEALNEASLVRKAFEKINPVYQLN